jgi:hypothetical protein
MSIYLKGDGQIYSSVAFTTITLPNPAISPDIMEDNVDVVEGDGGYTAMYQKGTYKRIFPYKFTLLTEAQKNLLWTWYQTIEGRSNWFLLQPYGQPADTVGLLDNEQIGTDLLYNSYLYEQRSWEGFWAFILGGDHRGETRKIIAFETDSNYIQVSPAFGGAIESYMKFILGYPVTLDEDKVEFVSHSYNYWDVQLIFREKVIDEI